MHTNLTWVPYDTPIIAAGFPISEMHVLNQQLGGASPAFAVPASPDSSNFSGPWTPHRYFTFLRWWSEGRQARPDDPHSEFLVRTAFANWELRLLAQDRDDRLLQSMAGLHQRHTKIFRRTGLGTRFNLLAQISSYSQGPDLHLGKIKWLQEIRA